MTTQRTQRVLILVAVLLVVLAASVWAGIYWKSQQFKVVTLQPHVVVLAQRLGKQFTGVTLSNQTLNPIDGVKMSRGVVQQYPVAVMIENAAFGGVRPQFGLSQAQAVYEMPVEGGITRFMAVFAGSIPNKLGPIRSARPDYINLAAEYSALYTHAGGSSAALAELAQPNSLHDLSSVTKDAGYFFRDGQRVPPHNLFTSADLVARAIRDKQLADTAPKFTHWPFQADHPPAAAPAQSKIITIDFGSSPFYTVQYLYNFPSNSYERWNGGEQQHDANTNAVLMPKNVVVQLMPKDFSVIGSGTAYLARDGVVTTGTWKKLDTTSRTQFLTSDGKPFAFNRGPIWIELVPANGKVTFN